MMRAIARHDLPCNPHESDFVARSIVLDAELLQSHACLVNHMQTQLIKHQRELGLLPPHLFLKDEDD